jgi:hypothetical protein
MWTIELVLVLVRYETVEVQYLFEIRKSENELTRLSSSLPCALRLASFATDATVDSLIVERHLT